MLISNRELKEKLNCKQDSKLIQWLQKHGVIWTRDAQGRPVTTLSRLEEAAFKADDSEEVLL